MYEFINKQQLKNPNHLLLKACSRHQLERNSEAGSIIFSMVLIKSEPQVWDAENAVSAEGFRQSSRFGSPL